MIRLEEGEAFIKWRETNRHQVAKLVEPFRLILRFSVLGCSLMRDGLLSGVMHDQRVKFEFDNSMKGR